MPPMRLMLRAQLRPQGYKLNFYPPPLEVFCNYVHPIYLLIVFTRQIVVVESCSCRREFSVLFRSPKSKTEHSAVRLRLKTSTKTILSTTSTIHYNSHINNHNLVKYYQIPALAVNSEVSGCQGRLQKTVTGDEGLGVR